MPNPIIVKKKQRAAAIAVDSHPTQQARAGDIVNFSMATDGQVEEIHRDFGNGQVVGCEDRSCASASSKYDSPGEYTITAEIQYSNDVPVKARVKIRVY